MAEGKGENGKEYLKANGIHYIMEHVVGQLVKSKPSDPLLYIIKVLETLELQETEKSKKQLKETAITAVTLPLVGASP